MWDEEQHACLMKRGGHEVHVDGSPSERMIRSPLAIWFQLTHVSPPAEVARDEPELVVGEGHAGVAYNVTKVQRYRLHRTCRGCPLWGSGCARGSGRKLVTL